MALIKEREAEFTARFWEKLDQYLKSYAVNGRKLKAREPDSVEFQGKKPDIVVADEKGIPVLIIETKRKAETPSEEFFLTPLTPAPIAQAACYAALAMMEYKLDKTPLYAVANIDLIILFKGISRVDLERILDVSRCLEPKKTADDWG